MQYCAKNHMNLKIQNRTAVREASAGASSCSCASVAQEGPGMPCLVQLFLLG